MKLKAEELAELLKRHKKYLYGEKDGKRADLSRADLSDANLSGANLSCANLRFANLSRANLRFADLSRADLSDANLSGANLRFADLSGANLRFANLSDANLSRANLRFANLSDADLSGANLRFANLSDANLSCANLRFANLSRADLSLANLSGAKNVFFPQSCPDEGCFTAFKKAANDLIVKLKIPESAKRSSATTRKCRCDKAVVLSIEYADGTQYEGEFVCSSYDKDFVYTVGQEVSVPDYDDNRWNECSKGIHFFITREEAVQYNL